MSVLSQLHSSSQSSTGSMYIQCMGGFKTGLKQNFSMRYAEMGLPASASAQDPLEMSNAFVTK